MPSNADFHIDTNILEVSLTRLDRKVELGIAACVDITATRGEFFMKTRAPWTDRTGNARSGLFTATKKEGNSFSILFSHTASYGIWLEVKDSGKYEIIIPAISNASRELPKLLQKTLLRGK
jgi:hypothetical protein